MRKLLQLKHIKPTSLLNFKHSNHVISTNFIRHYSPLPRYTPSSSSTQSARPKPKIIYQDSPSTSYTNPKVEYETNIHNSNGLITYNDGISRILQEPTLVLERQMELMNVFLGFEQANKYVILDALGNKLGYMLERDLGIVKMIMRQVYRLHRPFHVDVFDNYDNHVLTIKRPFSFINSHIKAILPGFTNEDDGIIGESIQSWHLWRRRYNLFKTEGGLDNFEQFGAIDSPFLAFDFPVRDENGVVIGAVDRNWVGLGREMFTDTGIYVLRMDPASFGGMGELYPHIGGPLTLDQRAILLGNAISIDFDYFSRHSNRGGLFSYGDYE